MSTIESLRKKAADSLGVTELQLSAMYKDGMLTVNSGNRVNFSDEVRRWIGAMEKEQRISFVYGNNLNENASTREQIEDLADTLLAAKRWKALMSCPCIFIGATGHMVDKDGVSRPYMALEFWTDYGSPCSMPPSAIERARNYIIDFADKQIAYEAGER